MGMIHCYTVLLFLLLSLVNVLADPKPYFFGGTADEKAPPPPCDRHQIGKALDEWLQEHNVWYQVVTSRFVWESDDMRAAVRLGDRLVGSVWMGDKCLPTEESISRIEASVRTVLEPSQRRGYNLAYDPIIDDCGHYRVLHHNMMQSFTQCIATTLQPRVRLIP